MWDLYIVLHFFDSPEWIQFLNFSINIYDITYRF